MNDRANRAKAIIDEWLEIAAKIERELEESHIRTIKLHEKIMRECDKLGTYSQKIKDEI